MFVKENPDRKKNYNENNEQEQLSEGFANKCYKIVSPILLQEPNNDFAVCEHSSGTLLLVEDVALSQGFVRISNFTFKKENFLSNSLKARPVTPKRNRYFEINRSPVRHSHQKCSIKKVVLKSSAIFTVKNLCWSLF